MHLSRWTAGNLLGRGRHVESIETQPCREEKSGQGVLLRGLRWGGRKCWRLESESGGGCLGEQSRGRRRLRDGGARGPRRPTGLGCEELPLEISVSTRW